MPGADVVVVGGGIVGCAVAYELSRRGLKVVLVERDELAAGASGRNHGLLVSPLDPILVPMAEATLAYYRTFAASSSFELTIDDDALGYLLVAADDEAERTAGQLEADAAASCGVPVEHLTPADVLRLEPAIDPAMVSEGWLLEEARRVQPGLLTTALGMAARALGADVRHHLNARALVGRAGTVTGVLTDEGVIEADRVVVAAGHWSHGLLRPIGVVVAVMPARGWLVSLHPETVPFTRLLGRAGWHSPPDPEGLPPPRVAEVVAGVVPAALATFMHPSPDGTVLVGGSRQPAFASEPEDPEIPRRLLQGAVDLVPELSAAPVLGAWWGLRPMTPDGRPFVGQIGDDLFVATGHGSLGVTLAGGTAQLLAGLILRQELPFDAAPFDPARSIRQ
jgi:glycine/D-amino acid oxidase-like deaminating enzyme